jgi:uncharacterized repeat protein (TIGR04076 family)
MFNVVVTVVEVECQEGYRRIGDRWEIESLTPQGKCLEAWGVVFPCVMVLGCDGGFSWEDVPTKIKIHCPDLKGITLKVDKMEDS